MVTEDLIKLANRYMNLNVNPFPLNESMLLNKDGLFEYV